MDKRPLAVAVSGVKNSGKTSLIVRLIPELNKRGLRVATVKHDGHRFEPDRPGTDSFRHLEAGAVGSAVFDSEKFQLVRKTAVDEGFLVSQFPEADLILLEGFKVSPLSEAGDRARRRVRAPCVSPVRASGSCHGYGL